MAEWLACQFLYLQVVAKKIENSGPCSLSCNKMWFIELVFAIKEYESGRYDVGTG